MVHLEIKLMIKRRGNHTVDIFFLAPDFPPFFVTFRTLMTTLSFSITSAQVQNPFFKLYDRSNSFHLFLGSRLLTGKFPVKCGDGDKDLY